MKNNQAKAIRIDEHGGSDVLKLVDVEIPAPAAGEVTLRQKAVGLNFIDIYFRTGLYPHPLPHGLGFEAAGDVVAVGEGVTHLKEGDRVAYGQSPIGAYAEMRNVPADKLVKLPDSISYDDAAAIMLKGLTVQYLFRECYRLQEGETILFHAAAGGVGLLACQWARALGVKLIGTASSPEKCALAKEHGAWEVIDYSRENVVERVKELTNGAKVPVVYDGVGKDTWMTSLDCLRTRGLMVSFGNASGPVEGVDLALLNRKGSLYVTRPKNSDYTPDQASLQKAASELFGLLADGSIKVKIGQRFPLAEAARAQDALASRKTVGATILTVD